MKRGEERPPGTLEVNGATLHYEARGTGPAVVFIHAGIADGRMWARELTEYADRFRVIAPDMRGFGRSDLPDGDFSFVDDLHVLLEQLGVERSVLVGCSMGGGTALEFALEHPNEVAGLVLVGAGLPDHDWSEEMNAADAREEELWERGDVEGLLDLNLDMWVAGTGRSLDQVPERVVARVKEMLHNAIEVQMAAEKRDPGPGSKREIDPPASGRLGEIDVPTLLIEGAHDVADIHELTKRLQRGIKNAQAVTIEGAAHLPNMERPQEFDDALIPFLERVYQ